MPKICLQSHIYIYIGTYTHTHTHTHTFTLTPLHLFTCQQGPQA